MNDPTLLPPCAEYEFDLVELADGTLAVDFTSTLSAITHTQYGAQKFKDAVVDQFRERGGKITQYVRAVGVGDVGRQIHGADLQFNLAGLLGTSNNAQYGTAPRSANNLDGRHRWAQR